VIQFNKVIHYAFIEILLYNSLKISLWNLHFLKDFLRLKAFLNYFFTMGFTGWNDENIISSISVTDIVFDDYFGKWNTEPFT